MSVVKLLLIELGMEELLFKVLDELVGVFVCVISDGLVWCGIDVGLDVVWIFVMLCCLVVYILVVVKIQFEQIIECCGLVVSVGFDVNGQFVKVLVGFV